MATQTIVLIGPTAMPTPTVRVFADGSDAQVSGSPFTLVEETNRKGYYSVTFTGTLAGLHLAALYSATDYVGSGWVTLTNADGTYAVRGDKEAALLTPAEAAGRPTTLEGMMRAMFERYHNERTRNRNTGAVAVKNEAGDDVLRTETQSTAGGVDSVTEMA